MKILRGVSGMVDSLRHRFPLQADDFISRERELPSYLLHCTMSAFVLSTRNKAHHFRLFQQAGPYSRLIHSPLLTPIWKATSLFTLPSVNQRLKPRVIR